MGLIASLQQHLDCLSNESCKIFMSAKGDVSIKKKAVEEDAGKIFVKAPLEGIGSESWRLLWEQARKYSEKFAYKAENYPYLGDGARCVLCQRELDQESRDRLTSFEKFVKGELQQLASDAEKTLEKVSETFTELPTVEDVVVKLDAAGIVDPAMRTSVIDFVSKLITRDQTRIRATTQEDISDLPSAEILVSLTAFASCCLPNYPIRKYPI